MCSIDITCVPPQVDNCTLTQGFYGNQNGKFNGINGPTLVTMLLTTGDLVVGKPGRSLTIKGGASASDSAQCLVKRMPGTQTPMCLPAGLGDATLSGFGSCQTNPALPLNGGKWSNVLLGQVVTLTLNLRLDTKINEPGHVALADRQICNTFKTLGALPGPDGKLGTSDDTINPSDPPQTFSIPFSVTCALTHLGLPHTVGGVLELANRALACQCIDVTTLGDINQAVDAINSGFDECRFLLPGSCVDSPGTCPPPATCATALLMPNSGDRMVAQSYRQFGFAPLANSFNPFDWAANALFQPNLGAIALAGNEATIEERFVSWLQPRRRSRWWM